MSPDEPDNKPKRIELRSQFPPTECASRLSGAIDREGSGLILWGRFFGSRPVFGSVTETSLHLRKRNWYRNDFQSVFSGEMRPDNGGTLITGQFSMDPFVVVLMAIGLWSALGIGCTMSIVTLAHLFSGAQRTDGNEWLGAVVPLGLFLSGLATVAFGRYRARNEAQFITDFLTRTLDATSNTRNT